MKLFNISALKSKKPMQRRRVNHLNSRPCKMNSNGLNFTMFVTLMLIVLKAMNLGTVEITTMKLINGEWPSIRAEVVLVTGSAIIAWLIKKTKIRESSSFTTSITIRQTLNTYTVKNVGILRTRNKNQRLLISLELQWLSLQHLFSKSDEWARDRPGYGHISDCAL